MRYWEIMLRMCTCESVCVIEMLVSRTCIIVCLLAVAVLTLFRLFFFL